MAAGRRPDRIADPWGARTPYPPGAPWPERVDVRLADGVTEQDVERWAVSASLLHSNGDAMDIAVRDGRIVGVRGRAGDRVNRGRLGPKDLYGWQANGSPDRLTRPLVRDGGRLVECAWDTAMERIVARSRALLDERGPGAFGFHTTGQLFLEEYYTLAVLARAGIGTHHLDGNTRLCTATAAEGVRLRRTARLLRGRRPRRHPRPVRAQHGRDADGAVDARPGPAGRPRPARPAVRRPAPHARRPPRRPAPGSPARHERGCARGVDLPGPGARSALREKTAGARERTAEALGRRPEPGLLLLHDLRDLHLAAARNSLHWEMLAQAARALRDGELLDLVSACHPQTLRQMRWTNTMVKEQAPQLLSAR